MRRNLVETQQLYTRVGVAIRRLRREACLTAREFARRVGVTETHVERVEDGTTPCSLHLLVAIADEFDTTLDELVPVAIDEKELFV